MYIPVVPAEDRSIERVSSWRSPNYVETQVRLRKDWRSVLSRRFSSSIKTTNINTEEIFSVHLTFFLFRRKYCSYSSLADTNTVKKKNNLAAKSDRPNIVFCFSIVKKRSISWHFRTSPQQSWSIQIIEDAENNEKLRRFFFLDLYSLRITTTCSIVGFKKQFFSSPLSCRKKKKKNNSSGLSALQE